jgi:hypothetical protein
MAGHQGPVGSTFSLKELWWPAIGARLAGTLTVKSRIPMDRRTKAALHRDKAPRLMAAWHMPVAQARYSHDGNWYALLDRFPAALVDANGYLLFESEHDYKSSLHLALGKQINVRKPGISAVPGYVRMLAPEEVPSADIDVHEHEGAEGKKRLLIHLSRERDRRLVVRKKKSSPSLACEVCGFSFASVYGRLAADYCEVHHLVPLAEAEAEVKTSLKDLAVVCANCHRVIHLKSPPFTLEEVKAMFRGPQ